MSVKRPYRQQIVTTVRAAGPQDIAISSQHSLTAPDALDALDAHLRDQLLTAGSPVHIDWTITPPTGPAMPALPAGDPKLEVTLADLHHGLVDDVAVDLYEASRNPIT